MAYEWPQGFRAEFFSPKEFDHPDLMDPSFIRDLDTLRMRCGFPITVNDDARTTEEHEHLYRMEISKGEAYPEDSSHLECEEGVRAGDIEPSPPKATDGCDLNLNERELEINFQILRLYKEGRWKHLGLGIETGHFHVDDTPRLSRPSFWVAVSR